MGKTLFMNKRKLLTGKLNWEQKKRIIKSTVWNVALYAPETWTLTKGSTKLLEAFENVMTTEIKIKTSNEKYLRIKV